MKLSPRELEILTWASNGKTVEETALILEASHSSVMHAVKRIQHKLDATNKVHAVAKAIRAGYIS